MLPAEGFDSDDARKPVVSSAESLNPTLSQSLKCRSRGPSEGKKHTHRQRKKKGRDEHSYRSDGWAKCPRRRRHRVRCVVVRRCVPRDEKNTAAQLARAGLTRGKRALFLSGGYPAAMTYFERFTHRGKLKLSCATIVATRETSAQLAGERRRG